MKLYTVYVGGTFKTAVDIEADSERQAESKAIDLIVDTTDLDLEIEDTDTVLVED